MKNFTELYDTTIDNLFVFGMKYTSDRELVKDCIQDVFVKFYTKRDYISVTANNVESYLYASLRNRLHDEFRHNSHLCDGEISDDSNASLLKDAEVFDLERMEDESSKINTVVRFLKCLSPRQQKITKNSDGDTILGVYRTVYSDGTEIYVNYSGSVVTTPGNIIIGAHDYARVKR